MFESHFYKVEKMNRYVAIGSVLAILQLFLILETSPSGSLVKAWATFSSIEGETVVYVDPQTCYAALGSTFRVNISIANVVNLTGYQFGLYYDTTLLDGVEVKLPAGHFLEPVDPVNIWIVELEIEDDFNSTHGRVSAALSLLYPECGNDGSGVLATITFHVIKSGNCTLDLHEPRTIFVERYRKEIACDVLDGYFESWMAEHEIAVFLEVPGHLVPGEATKINASIQNGGQDDETSVTLQLLIDGTIVDSIEISFLPVGSSHNLSYRWTPLDEVRYNVTAHAPALTGEVNTLNNVNSNMVAVSYVIKVPLQFPTIQEAIRAASSGDTIKVASGTYYEHLFIDRPVTLAGENTSNTIIDGSGTWKIVQIGEEWMYGWIGGSSKIAGFTIQNGLVGVAVESNDNLIEENTIKNCSYGIFLWQSVRRNIIRRNTIVNNECGILCDWASRDNMIYHNNFINNTDQAGDEGINTWDSGDEGNYWSDYNGTDTDEDNIGDASYEVNATQGIWDATPLMCKYVCLPGDLNDDGEVNTSDLDAAAASFGSHPRHPRWNPTADTNIDGRINVIDMALIARTVEKQSDVNDIWSPINMLELLAPWIGLASLIILVTVSILC
jgi:parallel beta-helix repeat protein